jgi:hypothetical protein
MNKYLEKIAFTHLLAGYAGAEKGDKVGGALIGGGVGGGAASTLTAHALLAANASPGAIIAGAIAASIAGGYLGGKAYSIVKKEFQGSDYHKKSASERTISDDTKKRIQHLADYSVKGGFLGATYGGVSGNGIKRGAVAGLATGLVAGMLKNNQD